MFLDCELPQREHSALFAHMAQCDVCRDSMSAVMEFRRMSRQHTFRLPRGVDEAVLSSLELSKKGQFRRDRYYERRPLWQMRATISLRMGAALAAVFFLAGLWLPHNTRQLEQISVEERLVPRTEANAAGLLYVWHPGLFVEAARFEEEEDGR